MGTVAPRGVRDPHTHLNHERKQACIEQHCRSHRTAVLDRRAAVCWILQILWPRNGAPPHRGTCRGQQALRLFIQIAVNRIVITVGVLRVH